MADTSLLNKSALHIESTQQALNLLRNLRESRKKQAPSSTYQLVKLIYSHLKGLNSKKHLVTETISSQSYLGNNKQSLEDMLYYIKDKIIEGGAVYSQIDANIEKTSQIKSQSLSEKQIAKKPATQQTNSKVSQDQHQKSKNIQLLHQTIKQKQTEIGKLNEYIKSIQHQSKTLQVKLMNNLKKVSMQLQAKQVELKKIKQAMGDKEIELEEMKKLNEKTRKKMRKLEQDMYELQIELSNKNEELQAERQCGDFLEKKISKLMQQQSTNIEHKQQNRVNLNKLETDTQTTQQ